MPIFDTHAHYDDSRFDGDREALLAALPDAGVGLVVVPGVDVPSSRAAAALAERYPPLCTPPRASTRRTAPAVTDARSAALRELWRSRRWWPSGRSAWTTTGRRIRPESSSRWYSAASWQLAVELDLPVIVHDREAHGDCLAIIREFPAVTGVFHCFSGSPGDGGGAAEAGLVSGL